MYSSVKMDPTGRDLTSVYSTEGSNWLHDVSLHVSWMPLARSHDCLVCWYTPLLHPTPRGHLTNNRTNSWRRPIFVI